MNKKRIKILTLCFLGCFALVACSRYSMEKPLESSQEKKTEQVTSDTSESKASNEDKKEQQKGDANFNGEYYSVKGKYGEVLIVNKQHPLSPDYNPGENATAKKALLQLQAAMREAGFDISDDYSGFRSYDTQTTLYNNYVASDGQEAADRYSARPGYSEHQTGLAFDIKDATEQLLTEPEASQWLAENAHKYGFIVRFPEGGEASTGYMPEQWHVRYIGKEAADIYESGQTLEEYFGVSGGDYEE